MAHCVYANTAERANMTEWKEWNGSDDQIAEMQNAEEGYVLRYKSGVETCHILTSYKGTFGDVKSYWIIPSDPLRTMKIRQARTGQPVWVRGDGAKDVLGNKIYQYCMYGNEINWNIPNAEYSFSQFE